MRKLILKKCSNCEALVKIIKDCDCKDYGISCCNTSMKELKANSNDAAYEKHVPTYKIENDKIIVTVNHVMEENHFIEWIACVTDNEEKYIYFKPNEEATAIFKYQSPCVLYAYCNKHGLWEKEVNN